MQISGSGMISIKFSHIYQKMPVGAEDFDTKLLAVIPCVHENLSDEFIEYDTKYEGGNYQLPSGKMLLLLLATNILYTDYEIVFWTTIRRWTPEKEKYYISHLGEQIKIEVEGT